MSVVFKNNDYNVALSAYSQMANAAAALGDGGLKGAALAGGRNGALSLTIQDPQSPTGIQGEKNREMRANLLGKIREDLQSAGKSAESDSAVRDFLARAEKELKCVNGKMVKGSEKNLECKTVKSLLDELVALKKPDQPVKFTKKNSKVTQKQANVIREPNSSGKLRDFLHVKGGEKIDLKPLGYLLDGKFVAFTASRGDKDLVVGSSSSLVEATPGQDLESSGRGGFNLV